MYHNISIKNGLKTEVLVHNQTLRAINSRGSRFRVTQVSSKRRGSTANRRDRPQQPRASRRAEDTGRGAQRGLTPSMPFEAPSLC